MGHRVTGFSRAEYVHSVVNCEERGHYKVWCERKYSARLCGREMGCYRSHSRRRVTVRRGVQTYENFNKWIELLSLVALNVSASNVRHNTTLYEKHPFFELISSPATDNAFGPEVCAKLSVDFASLRASAKEKLARKVAEIGDRLLPYGQTDWLSTFRKFDRAFALASDNGFVIYW